MTVTGTALWAVAAALWAWGWLDPDTRPLAKASGGTFTIALGRGWVTVGHLWQPRPAGPGASLSVERKEYLGLVAVQTDRVFQATLPGRPLSAKWVTAGLHLTPLVFGGALAVAALWGLWLATRPPAARRNRRGFEVVGGAGDV